MIYYFARQIRKLGKDQGGQSLAFVALVLLVLVAFMAVVVNVGHQVNTKIEIQNTADAAAVSGAAWLARGYNMVAALNQGMVHVVVAILTIVATWIIFTICTGFPIIGFYCGTMWSLYTQHAPSIIKELWQVALSMEDLQDLFVDFFPFIAWTEVYRITEMNKPDATGVPYPFVPFGKPEDPTTLTLHLERGSFKDILKKLPIPEKIVDMVNIDESGIAKGESTKTQTFKKNEYADAVKFEEEAKGKVEDGGKYKSGHVGRKIENKTWYYNHKKWKLNPVYQDLDGDGVGDPDGKCIRCDQVLETDKKCESTKWKGTDYIKEVDTCCGRRYPVEEWEYCQFKVTITARKDTDPPDRTPQPMNLSSLFPKRDWIAVIVTDTGKSSKPSFLPGFLSQKNFWGTLGLAQARVLSESTEVGEMLYEMDWDARLTKVTALDQIFERYASQGYGGEEFKKAAERLLTH